jgi:hypothetical protein
MPDLVIVVNKKFASPCSAAMTISPQKLHLRWLNAPGTEPPAQCLQRRGDDLANHDKTDLLNDGDLTICLARQPLRQDAPLPIWKRPKALLDGVAKANIFRLFCTLLRSRW